MVFPLPQSVQHSVPGLCGVCTLPHSWVAHPDGKGHLERLGGTPWWDCPTVFPEVSKFHLFFGYVVSFVSTVICLQIPLTVPVPLCLASASSAFLGH